MKMSERAFQATFCMTHGYAALLASVAVLLHIAAARYHFRRWRNA